MNVFKKSNMKFKVSSKKKSKINPQFQQVKEHEKKKVIEKDFFPAVKEKKPKKLPLNRIFVMKKLAKKQ